jgi:hypothetical protein
MVWLYRYSSGRHLPNRPVLVPSLNVVSTEDHGSNGASPESKTEYEDEFEYDWGTKRKQGGSGAIAESVFLSRGIVRV